MNSKPINNLFPVGIASVLDAMANVKVGPKNKSVRDVTTFETNVGLVLYNVDKYSIYNSDRGAMIANADIVISTIPNWAAQVSMYGLVTNPYFANEPEASGRLNSDSFPQGAEEKVIIASANARKALRSQHIISSSKTFLFTKDKFWLKNNLPANIQSDTYIRGLYCLDYTPDDPNGMGVVLISYTWQDDSSKQVANGGNTSADLRARIQQLVQDISNFFPDFAEHLIPATGNYDATSVVTVDWLTEPNYHGAFKLNQPGQSALTANAFLDFATPRDEVRGENIFIAGDGISFYGGWTEGAFQTGLNAACGVLRQLGVTDLIANNPIDKVRTGEYNYKTGKS